MIRRLHAISGSPDREQVIVHLYEALGQVFRPDALRLHLQKEERLEPVPRPGAVAEEAHLHAPSAFVLRAFQSQTPARADLPSGGWEMVVPLVHDSGSEGALELRFEKATDWSAEDEDCLALLALCAAVSLKHAATLELLSRDRERLETLIEASADAIITTDRRGNITLFSLGAEEIFGYKAKEVLGTAVMDYYYRGRREAERVMEQLREQGKVQNYETWFRSKSGRGIPASLSCSLLFDREGRVEGTLGVLKDITRQKEMEEKLNYTIERLQEANEQLEVLAITDPLSGLYNHRYFYRELDQEMERSIRTRRPVTVLMIDIDRFKQFNDTYGHQVGDQIIEEIGRVIQKNIRRVDTGCRYGGEEFTVILPETSEEEAEVVADRIRLGFSRSSLYSELKIRPTTLSIGICRFDPRKGRISAADLVRLADDAMYRAKRSGGDSIGIADKSSTLEEGDVLG